MKMGSAKVNPYDKLPEDIELNLRSVDISDPDILNHKANRRRRSPIMVEFNEIELKAVDIARALEAGMNIVKFRMAFSTKSEKARMLYEAGKAAERCSLKRGAQCPVATCAPLKTWVKKIGIFKEEMNEIIQDTEVILTCDHSIIDKCTPNLIYVDYPHIAKDIHVGMEINLGQGNVVMYCIGKVNEKSIKCRVHKGCEIKSLETAYFRNSKNTMPYLSKTDVNILKFCAQYQIDVLIIYYAKDGEMIKRIKHLISKAKLKPLIYSGICNQDGIDNLDEILQQSDGIVFCRDYLTYELESKQIYRMSLLQKWVAGKCQQVGKPMFITAVFDYILANGDVSDAEVSDVTNALMDGVTGFILRNCSDINNTIYALKGLNDLCCQVEPLTFDKNVFWRMMIEPKVPVNAAEAAVLSCVAAANQTSARVVVLTTVTGRTARSLLLLRPCSIVIAICSRIHTARILYTCRNIIPLIYKGSENVKWHDAEEDRVRHAAEFAVAKQLMSYGDMYVSMQRSYEGHLFCDVVRVWKVTFAKKMLVECHYGSEDEEKSKESGEEKYVVEKKKRRRKKKKETEEKAEEEHTEKETKLKDTISVNITKSQIAHVSEKAIVEDVPEEAQDEEEEDENEEDKNEDENEEDKNEEDEDEESEKE